MRDLIPFLKLYSRHKWALSAGILLAFTTMLFSLSLLGLSGWFISATALAGLTAATAQSFDFFSPGAGVRGFSIGRTASRYFERLVSHSATFELLAWLRSWFFSKLLPLSLIRLKRYRSGELLNRLVADIDALDQLYLRLISPVIAAVLIVLLLSSGLYVFSPLLGKSALMLLGGWLLILPLLFYRLGKRSGQLLGKLQGDLRQTTLDYLQGMAEAQMYGAESSFRTSINETETGLHQAQATMSRLDGLGLALLTFGAGFAAVAMLYLAVGEYQSGVLSAPVMVLSVFAVLASFEALMPLPAAFQILGHTQLAAARLQEVLNEAPTIYGSRSLTAAVPDIQFHSVSYRYSELQPWILKDIDLNVLPGEHIALLGKTGCGKSTLIRLLTRQLPAAQQSIFIDGIAIEDLAENSLFSVISVVPQKTHVFSATLRDNLQMAKPLASDEELLSMVSEVGLDSLAGNDSDDKLLDVWLGEGGIALSGGEQRRLAIARILLKDSPVLIMDEPSEGLDPVSENLLMTKVIDRYQGKTLLMITHKQVMLNRMDRVIRMRDGKIED